MSYSDKNNEVFTKEEWLKILDKKEIGRTSMNKLIMNYLVIGKYEKLNQKKKLIIFAI